METNAMKALVLTLISRDPTLTGGEKQDIIHLLSQPNEFEKMLAGTKGAALAFLISKYLKLTPQAQVLLSIAGFGLGSYFKSKASDKRQLVQYNDKIKAYELNQYATN